MTAPIGRDSAPCPHCGNRICELYDHHWPGEDDDEFVLAECGSCEQPIVIHRRQSVTYTIEKVEQ